MTSLVTGGAGFIGSYVAEELSKAGEQVIVLDDLSGGFIENLPGKNITFIQGNIVDHHLVDRIFTDYKFDYVYHLAAYAAEGLSHFIKRYNYTNNLIGSINLINASINHNIRAFVFTSSIAVYGKNQLPMHEDLLPDPEDSYGISKLAVERELHISHDMFGLNYIIFRPHNVYGERQNIGDWYRNVIGIFMNNILLNKPMAIFGDGEQTRAFTYILDVAPVIARSVQIAEAYNQVFNVGSDVPYTLNALALEVARAMGVAPQIIYNQTRNEVKHVYASHEKVKRVFNPPPPVPLDIGLKRMADWVTAVGSRAGKKFDQIEINRNLPPAWLKD